MESAKRFEEKLARIHDAVGSDKPSVLARILGIDPASIASAKKRKQIPGGWVEAIAEKCDISANWLYFGYGDKQMLKHDDSRTDEGQEIKTETRAAEGVWVTKSKEALLFEMLGSKEQTIEAHQKTIEAQEREIKRLVVQVEKLEAENAELKRPSLSTDASAESAPAKTA